MISALKFPAIFRNSQFLRLWGNQLVLQVAFNMCNYAALLILADRTHSPFAQAQFYAALTLPAFIFGFFAGPLVDMFDKKKVMIVSNFILIILFFLYIFIDAGVLFIMLIAFLTSSVARFFIPAAGAAIPRLVSRDFLEQANTFFILTLLGSVLLGYAIAGPIMQAFGGLGTAGEKAPFIIGSIFLVGALLFLFSLKRIPPVRLEVSTRGSIFKATIRLFLDTFKEVKGNISISVPLGLLVFVELIVGMMSILLLEYVRRYLELPLTSVSYVLIGPLVIGLIAGVSVLSKIERFYGHRSILLACAWIGMILFSLGIVPVVAATVFARFFTIAAAFLMGVFVVIITVQARTMLQLNTRAGMHGRIFSFLDILIALVIPIPVLILGFAADKISILIILSFSGILTLLVVFLSSVRIRRNHAGAFIPLR